MPSEPPRDGPPPEPPGELLLERRTADTEDVYVERVTEAGQVWRRTNVRATLAGGDWSFEAKEPAWEHLGTLAPGALAVLRATVAGSGVEDVADEHAPSAAVIGGTEEQWRIATPAGPRTIRVHGRPVTRVPALEALAEALDEAVGAVE